MPPGVEGAAPDGGERADGERTERLGLGPEVHRLVVLGDPHGDLIGLDLVLGREAGPGTVVVSAGDNVGYADGKVSSFLCQALEERGIRSVYGNHEDWSREGRLFLSPPGLPPDLTPEALAWVRGLPYRLRIEAAARPRVSIDVVHTLPGWAYVNADSAERLADLEQARVVLCGHTHRPAIYTLRRGARRPKVRRLDPVKADPVQVRFDPGCRYVVDAGSLGRPSRPRGGLCLERGTYAVFDLVAGVLELRSVDKTARLQALLLGS